jgi:general secretion pathway protein G
MRKQMSRRARGFSLLELMLVVAIMGVLMAVVAVNVLGKGTKAKISATKSSMATIQTELDAYNLEYSAYPTELTTLQKVEGYLAANKPIEDGWKRTYFYQIVSGSTTMSSKPYSLLSAGDDGEFGTQDDIDVWTMHGMTEPQR